MEQILQRLIDFKKAEKDLKVKVKEFVQNKENDFDTRWKVFIEGNYGEENYSYWYFESLNEDDFHSDIRENEVCFPSEVIEWFNNNYDNYNYEWKLEDEIKSFKEECMQRYIRFWTNN